jgi:hypothetical protein
MAPFDTVLDYGSPRSGEHRETFIKRFCFEGNGVELGALSRKQFCRLGPAHRFPYSVKM